ncbi:hypothetical protein SAMN05216388_1001234 [Halorientalis persicus]|uniref:Uncharacterized protein n=1 Tax=Halorientalis persicus TaxID=1367881 RepID=A0A1H8DB58_9EURY|nr:hypothetical protein [Halorientalis persicus]SEN04489.1 hypothetical protein SAMN05216388_1001234 [Halorientalis persicus]
MNELADSMDVLADPDAWIQAAAVGGGYAGSAILDSLIVGMAPGPDAVAGVASGAAVGAGGYVYGGEYSEAMTTGGLLFAVGSVAEHFGFKQQIFELGQGGGN